MYGFALLTGISAHPQSSVLCSMRVNCDIHLIVSRCVRCVLMSGERNTTFPPRLPKVQCIYALYFRICSGATTVYEYI